MSYNKAQNLIDGNSKYKLSSNTFLKKIKNKIYITVNHSNVLTINPDDEFVIKSDRIKSQEARYRINQFLPDKVKLIQKDNIWFVEKENKKYLFKEGIKIGRLGGVSNHGTKYYLRTLKQRQKLISIYCDEYIEKLFNNSVFYINKTYELPRARTVQLVNEDKFNSLIMFNAVKMFPVKGLSLVALYDIFERNARVEFLDNIIKDNLKKSLKKYLKYVFKFPV